MGLKTCVAPNGTFTVGVHKPHFCVKNMRKNDYFDDLGLFPDNSPHRNTINFPKQDIKENAADWIFEISNPFPFKGTTYIAKRWADKNALAPESIELPAPKPVSISQTLRRYMHERDIDPLLHELPEPILFALASTSTDPDDLISLANLCCDFTYNKTSEPNGLRYTVGHDGRINAAIHNRTLFEILANNRYLPDIYKNIMVLKPGVQGNSEIVGEWLAESENSHIFEYLRRNSYIPWGHYAANMANDAVRYRIKDITLTDMIGLRHLYYQRSYTRIAAELNIHIPVQKGLSHIDLEELRQKIATTLSTDDAKTACPFTATLWGWNFGFDYAPSEYRLHASHQQIHQQFALIPKTVSISHSNATSNQTNGRIPAFACGDMIAAFIQEYKQHTGKPFFDTYLNAIHTNVRMDGQKDREASLVVYADEDVILFVPKAQTSQWELQLMPLKPVGNILETNIRLRRALDRGIFVALKILEQKGARMVTSIEYSKRFDSSDTDQRLLYVFLPKLPESPGAFSEAQLRWINGHYPEDFAFSCRDTLSQLILT